MNMKGVKFSKDFFMVSMLYSYIRTHACTQSKLTRSNQEYIHAYAGEHICIKMEWNEMEWNGMEWNGMELSYTKHTKHKTHKILRFTQTHTHTYTHTHTHIRYF